MTCHGRKTGQTATLTARPAALAAAVVVIVAGVFSMFSPAAEAVKEPAQPTIQKPKKPATKNKHETEKATHTPKKKKQKTPAGGMVPEVGENPAAAGVGVTGAPPAVGGGEENSSSEAPADPFMKNGMISLACREAAATQTARENCQRSGSAVIGQNSAHYGLDIHVDIGLKTIYGAMLQKTVEAQWFMFVLATKIVVFCLDWSFGFSLLDPASMGEFGAALKRGQTALSDPLLKVGLFVFAVWLFWTGAMKGAVSRAIGGATHSTVLGLFLLALAANPISLIGDTNRKINHAAIALINVVSPRPAHGGPKVAYQRQLKTIVDQTLTPAFAWLEFGDVDWATNPNHKDRQLAKAAADLATDPIGKVSKKGQQDRKRAVAHAKTNADLFLAFPANSPERNAINDQRSLYRKLCGQENDTDEKCINPYAQARQGANTHYRMVQIVCVGLGLLCVFLMFGVVICGVLSSQIMLVFHTIQLLVMGPVAFFGDRGRQQAESYLEKFARALFAKMFWALTLCFTLLVFQILSTAKLTGFFLQWILATGGMGFMFINRKKMWGTVLRPSEVTSRGGLGIIGSATSTAIGIATNHAIVAGGQKLAGLANRKPNRPPNPNANRPTNPPPPFRGPNPPGPQPGSPPQPPGTGTGTGPGSADNPPPAPNGPSAGAPLPTPPSFTSTNSHLSAAGLPDDFREKQDRLFYSKQAARSPVSPNVSGRIERQTSQIEQLDQQLSDGGIPAGERVKLNQHRHRLAHRREQLQTQPESQQPIAKENISSWLDHQATLPPGNSRLRESRDYRRLINLLPGGTTERYDKAPDDVKFRARGKIDRDLARRTAAPKPQPPPLPPSPVSEKLKTQLGGGGSDAFARRVARHTQRQHSHRQPAR